MQRRYVSIWFSHLVTDWFTRRQPDLAPIPFVIVSMERGQAIISAVNESAERAGVHCGMALADARALEPSLVNFDDKPDLRTKLLNVIAEWLVRYTPIVSIDGDDGIMLDVTGCAHLHNGEVPFLKDLVTRLRGFGYDARAAMADTAGAAWAVSRYGRERPIIAHGCQKQALSRLPVAALRLEAETATRLNKLGFRVVSDLYKLPRANLSRRFGKELILRLDQAAGEVQELLQPIQPAEPYEERIAFPDGVATIDGIVGALIGLISRLCGRLQTEHSGIRSACLTCYRLDGKVERLQIGTSRPCRDARRLFQLFQTKIEKIDAGFGIEVFVLSASGLAKTDLAQDEMLDQTGSFNQEEIYELIDKLANRIGENRLRTYQPQESYLPERSFKRTPKKDLSFERDWLKGRLRPLRVLPRPEPIEAMSPVPDYPPVQFRLRGRLHRIKKADGPERIEREWWLDDNSPRDYYRVEDEDGRRYWVYRAGHYTQGEASRWFLHGFFP